MCVEDKMDREEEGIEKLGFCGAELEKNPIFAGSPVSARFFHFCSKFSSSFWYLSFWEEVDSGRVSVLRRNIIFWVFCYVVRLVHASFSESLCSFPEFKFHFYDFFGVLC